MSGDSARYLAMNRRHYANLVARSDYSTEAFTTSDAAEIVVGSYAQHEAFDYERWLLDGLKLEPESLALDYGCGPGRMLLRFAPRFARVDGIDISPEVLDVARRRTVDLTPPPRLYLTPGDQISSGLEEVYDLAFSVICLQHICVYSVRYRILEGLYRSLKGGGVLTFQMGYGPGHANMVDYETDHVDAPATNGVVDVGVLHPGEVGADLARIGFRDMAYALVPTGPGDHHGAWIFLRAVKPGMGAALRPTGPSDWAPFGFYPLRFDASTVSHARQAQRVHGVVGRRRTLHQRTGVLEAALKNVSAERDLWRARAEAQTGDHR